MKKRVFYAFVLVLVCGCSFIRKHKDTSVKAPPEAQKSVFFVPVPITKFGPTQCPCIEVNIDGTTFSMELDLGAQGDLSISEDFIDHISSKTFLHAHPMYGIRGKEYINNLYQIPEMTIGDMSFTQPILRERPVTFLQDSAFVKDGGKPSPREPGRLGWGLFYNTNLLLDAKNARIAFCDSLDTLKKHGYATETFARVPIVLDDGLVEFDVMTPQGAQRCMLDTGSTFNILNTDAAGNKPIEEAIWDSENFWEYSSFQIGERDFGPITFRPISLHTPIPIKAIIGMEFLKDHLLFIDFSEGYVYFAKDSWLGVPNFESGKSDAEAALPK